MNLHSTLEELKDPVISPAVLEILETWIDLLINYPEEILALDFVSLHDYMSDRAELFHERYGRGEKPLTSVSVHYDSRYLYEISSVVLVKESSRLYYPYSLVIACNYPQAVSLFCSEFEKTDLSLVSLFDVLYTILKSGKPFLFDADIDLISRMLALDIQGKIPVSELIDEYVKTNEFNRLSYLQIFQLYYAVNFPVLGLFPYMQLLKSGSPLMETYQEFIETEYLSPDPFRILLLPRERERELIANLEDSLTSKILGWYDRYDLQYLERGITGYWTWSRGLTSAKGPVSARTFKLVNYDVPEVSLTPVHATILDTVHRHVTIPPAEVANVTGINKRTVYDYFKRAIELGVIIPYWGITRTGLDEHIRVILASEPLDGEIATYLDHFPKTETIRGSKFTSIRLFLPPEMGKQVKNYLKTCEREGKCQILSLGTITTNSRTVNRGFDLLQYLTEKKRVKRKRKAIS